ncbi:hypothetical protein HLB42_07735 [Deinococcus sp. D7000]|nr:hypothetical protein HLB42_07735 [Deinococcus sp. D7000]
MDGQPTLFHEVFTVGGWPVGVQDNIWAVKNREGTSVALPAYVAPGLVTLLERAPADFAAELKTLLQDRGLDAQLAESFPLVIVLRLGLEWPGGGSAEHWQGLALHWVETLQCADKVISALEVTAINGRTQRHRQRAKRLLKHARRS